MLVRDTLQIYFKLLTKSTTFWKQTEIYKSRVKLEQISNYRRNWKD